MSWFTLSLFNFVWFHKINSRTETVLSFERKPNGVLRWLLGSEAEHTGCSLCWGKMWLILRVQVLDSSFSLAFSNATDAKAGLKAV